MKVAMYSLEAKDLKLKVKSPRRLRVKKKPAKNKKVERVTILVKRNNL